MPAVGLKQAAELTGKNQSTIHRAMKNGKLAFTHDANGDRVIDVSELERVFPVSIPEIAQRNGENQESHDSQGAQGGFELRMQLEAERVRTASLQERIADKEAVIQDLRARLDAEAEERRRTQAQLTALLTDQRTQPASAPAPAPAESATPEQRRRWWRIGGKG
jgi:uncharacterized coiled-coil protein SlyX